ncbi:hypothetical protein J8803_29680, partial [Klebsiella pneumoniae]
YTPPFLGRRRGWLLTTQVLLLLAIAAMGFLEPVTQLRWMAALLVPCIIATLLAPEPSDVIPVPRSLEQAVAEPLRDFFGR